MSLHHLPSFPTSFLVLGLQLGSQGDSEIFSSFPQPKQAASSYASADAPSTCPLFYRSPQATATFPFRHRSVPIKPPLCLPLYDMYLC